MARRSSRHLAATSRRATPRRWPALLAIPGLLVAAGVVDRGHRTRQRAQITSAAPAPAEAAAALMPVASRRSALSSTWFCAGGTARGVGGPAELSLLIANLAPTSVGAEVTVYDAAGGAATKQITVPAKGRTRVDATDVHRGAWAAAMVEARGGQVAVERSVKGPDGFDSGPCSSSSSNQWLFAEGSTLRGADEYLALFNPYADDASLDIRFTTEDGVRTPRYFQGFQVPGRSLRVVRVTTQVTRRAIVGATVTVHSGHLIVDRIQIFDGSGDREGTGSGSTDPPRGLVVTAGAPAPATTWSFPEGIKRPGARSRVVVYNPSGRDTDVDIEVALDDPTRNGVLDPIPLHVPAGEVRVFDLTDQQTIPDGVGSFITVRSRGGVGVVAEQQLSAGKPWKHRGVAVTLGSPLVAGSWMFAAGSAARDQPEHVAVANLGGAPVTLSLRMLATGRLVSLPQLSGVRLGGHQRVVLNVDAFRQYNLPLVLEASGPVTAELARYLVGPVGASLSLGLPVPETVADPPPPR